MTKAPFQITLFAKDGTEVQATVKRPTIDLSSSMQELSLQMQFLREERKALYLSSDAINAEFAIAEMESGVGSIPINPARLKEAKGRRDTLNKNIAAKDKKISELLIDQFKLSVNVSKGNEKKAPEVSWGDTPTETIQEAIRFFLTGKRPSETTAQGSEETGLSSRG
jgi:hypothetical protein